MLLYPPGELMEQNSENQAPLPKRRALRKWHAIAACLICIIGVQSIFLFVLFRENSVMKSDFASLSLENTRLESNYDELQNRFSQLDINYSLLQSNYDGLQSDYNAYAQSYQSIKDQINLHSTHPTENEKQLVTPTDSNVTNRMIQITGGWSNPSDWNEYWSDMRKLYDWVTSNIKYVSDPTYPSLRESPLSGLGWSDDNWQFPNETLRTMQGDCDDQALLLASLLLAYNSQKYAVYCILIIGHAALFLPVTGDQIIILDPTAGYSTNSGWPSYGLTSKDIRQEINNWLSYIGGNRQVYEIFTNDSWRMFAGTEDFITWMYNYW